jgi:hypothetical protein
VLVPRAAAVLGAVLAASLAVPAYAAAPAPDAGFGTGGSVVDTGQVQYYDALATADGGVVTVSGTADAAAVGDKPGTVTRLDATGAPVGTFGTGGTTSVTKAGYQLVFTQVQHGPAGTLVVIGGYAKTGAECGVAVARLSATTGALDASFGSGGVALLNVGGHLQCAQTGVAGIAFGPLDGTVLPDGRVLVTDVYFSGTSGGRPNRNSPMRVYVAALTATGAPSTVLGPTGYRLLPFTTIGLLGHPHLTADGSPVIGVGTHTASEPAAQAMGAIRLRPDGTPDPTFSGDGLAVRRPFGYYLAPGSVEVVPQSGRRLVAGVGIDTLGAGDEYQDSGAFVRFTASGGTDITYAKGTGVLRIPTFYVGRAERLSDGSLVVAGAENNGVLSADGFPRVVGRIAHASADCVADSTWGTGGVRSLLATGAVQTSWSGVAAGSDGALTFAGRSATTLNEGAQPPATWSATLARLTSTPPAKVRGWLESRLSGAYGGWRSCGTTVATPCALGTTWYLTGGGWPFEARDDARVIVQVQRRGADGVWRSYNTPMSWVTDDGAFRGAGKLVSVGLYRFRAAVPASATTLLTYSAWTYGKR